MMLVASAPSAARPPSIASVLPVSMRVVGPAVGLVRGTGDVAGGGVGSVGARIGWHVLHPVSPGTLVSGVGKWL
ncbi:hypothetical protein OJJOAM_004387 [Cupriavidus sp. H18C1]|uniref:hypothetical protein n=1 Tax=Cupriavidus sp. H18C1 TaxID=3241601 RepID=UPI003BB86977